MHELIGANGLFVLLVEDQNTGRWEAPIIIEGECELEEQLRFHEEFNTKVQVFVCKKTQHQIKDQRVLLAHPRQDEAFHAGGAMHWPRRALVGAG